MIFLVALVFIVWFWRRDAQEGTLWMLGTYAGLGYLFWQDYQSASALGGDFSDSIPLIARDFLMLGMVGFVQNLAIHKRIPIWMAVLLTLGIFTAAHFLNLRGADVPSPSVSSVAPATAPSTPELDANGEFLVQVDPANSSFQSTAFQFGWTARPAFAPDHGDATDLDDYFVLDVDDVASAERLLAQIDGVVYYEPNEVVRLDPREAVAPQRRNPRLAVDDPDTDKQWVMDALGMDAYYRLLAEQTPQKTARIAILDTGVDGGHEDIKANYFSLDARNDNDPVGHGTHCAGIAAGVTNNGLGIASLAGGSQPFVEVTSVKVLSAGGMGTQKTIIAGILAAADAGVDVISLSLGGPSNRSRQKAYSAAVRYAVDQGCIVVAAAGNSRRNAKDYSPANATGIISVTAVDENLQRAVFSNTVENLKQGIAAPGVAIFSTTPDNNYKVYSGTSMACPFVAGLLGVMRAVDPDLSAAEAYRILNTTGTASAEGKTTGNVVRPVGALGAVVEAL